MQHERPPNGPPSLHVTEIEAASGFYRPVRLSELWDFRELVLFFALRDVKVRYKQTLLGVAWVVIAPLIAVAILNALLGRVQGLPNDGVPYPVFVFSGFVLWTMFSSAVTSAGSRLVDNPDLVTKVYFPRLIAPMSAVLPPLIDLAVALVVLCGFLVAYRVGPGPAVLLLPLWIGAACVLAFAVGTWLAALNVQYRDVRYALSFLLQLWFFASPVVYASSIVEGAERWLLSLNPVVGLLDGFRWSVVGAPPPTLHDLVSLLVGLVLLVTGVLYFQRVERRFADVI